MAITKWEKSKKKRLGPVNEVAVRSLFGQLMKVEIRGWLDVLRGEESTPKRFELKAA